MKTFKTRKWELIQGKPGGIGNGDNLPSRFLENTLDTETMPFDLHGNQEDLEYSEHGLLLLVEQALLEPGSSEEIEDEALNHVWRGIAKPADDLEYKPIGRQETRSQPKKQSIRSSPSCPIAWD
ncbi:MAG: hypothetical protein ACE5EK_11670 [Nitrospinales bacterium]